MEEEGSDDGNRDSGVSGVVEEEAVPSAGKGRRSPVKKTSTAVEPPDFFDLRPVKGQKLRQLSNNFQSPRRVAFADQTAVKGGAEEESNDRSEVQQNGHSSLMDVDEASRDESPMVGSDESSSSTSLSKVQIRPTNHVWTIKLTSHQSRKSPSSSSQHHEGTDHAPYTSSSASPSIPDDDIPQLTMADKLRAARLEAEEAMANNKPATTGAEPTVEEVDDLDLELDFNLGLNCEDGEGDADADGGDVPGKLPSPARKTRIKGRPRRRKSTLSPEELESLLGLE